MGDDGVVFCKVLLDCTFAAGPFLQPFITDYEFAIIEGVFGKIVCRKGNIFWVVHIDEFFGCLPWVVWGFECDVGCKRFFLGSLLQELDGFVGEGFAAMFIGAFKVNHLSLGAYIRDGGVELSAHASEINALGFGE